MTWARSLLVFAFLALAAAVFARADPAIQWGACPGGNARSVSAAVLRCGWLRPRQRLAGQTIRLRVARLQARPDRIDPHPIIYIPGGPGDAAGLDGRSLRGWQRFQQRAGWDHDLILFDPRGTGASRPRPDCRPPSPDAAAPEKGVSSTAAMAQHCFDRLGRQTAQALGPDAQVDDLQALRRALDLSSVNLWAVSYGSRIARLYAQRHPARVRAMALDSPVIGNGSSIAVQVGGALQALRVRCRQVIACVTAVPAPRELLKTLLTYYARYPARLSLADVPRRAVAIRVTPERLLAMILFSEYEAATQDRVAPALRAAWQGRESALTPLQRRLMVRRLTPGHSRAVYWSTRCAFAASHHQPIRPPVRRPSAERDAYWIPYLPDAGHADGACAGWPVGPVPPAAGRLPAPTLMLVGGRDVLTPAAAGREFVATHSRARLLRVSGAAHAVSFASGCAGRVLARFWNHPGRVASKACGSRAGKAGAAAASVAVAKRDRHDDTNVGR